MRIIKKVITEWIIPIIIAIIMALLINNFVFFKVQIPSGSMLPTIQLKSQIIVTRIYNFKNIKRGDILVFYSKELNDRLIKRVIGLPGDTVEVKTDGSVFVNNEKLSEPYVAMHGGKTGIFKVPENKYFFLGDNRPDSLDSRYWVNSYISSNDIKGKAQLTVYPFNKFGILK